MIQQRSYQDIEVESSHVGEAYVIPPDDDKLYKSSDTDGTMHNRHAKDEKGEYPSGEYPHGDLSDVITRDIGSHGNGSTLDLSMDSGPAQKNLQPFRETLSEFEMLAKAGMLNNNDNNDKMGINVIVMVVMCILLLDIFICVACCRYFLFGTC